MDIIGFMTASVTYFWALVVYLVIFVVILLWLLRKLFKTTDEQKKILTIAGLLITILLLIIGAVSILIWGKADLPIAYVPVPILEWAFIGGMVGVLYRLAFQEDRLDKKLYLYILVKPVIGVVMGALVFFLAMGTSILLGSGSYQQVILSPNLNQTLVNETLGLQFMSLPGANVLIPRYIIYWLCAVAFVGGFSDRFSIDLIDRFLISMRGDGNTNVKEEEGVKRNE